MCDCDYIDMLGGVEASVVCLVLVDGSQGLRLGQG
jgi:hypothetical protein